MERLRKIKITVYVDTNKETYERMFENIEDAKEYLEMVLEDVDC
jgi:rhamnose utilization protein RhaD (predicted bifunctional aldolase and dehydrogenase)